MPDVDIYADCPGFAEAARRESELRSVPFLGLNEKICGHEIKPMTLRHLLLMDLAKSPFLSKAPLEVLCLKPGIENDVTMFLWIVSPLFEAGNEKRRRRFNKSYSAIVKEPIDVIVKDIMEYVDEAWMDAGESDGSRTFYSTAASLAGAFNKHFGLEIDIWENSRWRNIVRKLTGRPNVMDIPLKIAFQFLRVTRNWEDSEGTFENKLSDARISEWLKTKQPPADNIEPMKQEQK